MASSLDSSLNSPELNSASSSSSEYSAMRSVELYIYKTDLSSIKSCLHFQLARFEVGTNGSTYLLLLFRQRQTERESVCVFALTVWGSSCCCLFFSCFAFYFTVLWYVTNCRQLLFALLFCFSLWGLLCLFHLNCVLDHKVKSETRIITNTRTRRCPPFASFCFLCFCCNHKSYQFWVIVNRQSVPLISLSFTSPRFATCDFRFAFAVRFAARSPAKWLRWADASHVLCQRRRQRR